MSRFRCGLLPEVVGTVFEYLGFERAKGMEAPPIHLVSSEPRELKKSCSKKKGLGVNV